jgi:hypothetical protein
MEEKLVVFKSLQPVDRLMLCVAILSILAMVYSQLMDKISPQKFMKVCYPSMIWTLVINTVLLTVLAMIVWIFHTSNLLLKIILLVLVPYCLVSTVLVLKTVTKNATDLALDYAPIAFIMCKMLNVRSILPTPEVTRSCVSMVLLTILPPYLLFLILRSFNKYNTEENGNAASTTNALSTTTEPPDAATTSYIVCIFYALILAIIITILNLLGGFFPAMWHLLTGSTNENTTRCFIMFLSISLTMCGLVTMSPPKENVASQDTYTTTASILENVFRSSCVNNFVVSLIAGISFCTIV